MTRQELTSGLKDFSLGTRSHTRTRNKFSRENENHVDNQTISEQCSMPECPGNIDYFMYC